MTLPPPLPSEFDGPQDLPDRPSWQLGTPPPGVPALATALVVDDEVSLRLVNARGLQKCGFVCQVAENGRAALDLIDGGLKCDAVVTDLRMPVMDGRDLCLELLSRPDRPALIVLTGVAEADVHAELLNRGVDGLFFKPVSYRRLGKALQDALATRRAA